MVCLWFLKLLGLDSGLVFTEALKNFLPASLLPLGIILFFAGIMSSADTNAYGIAPHFVLKRPGIKSSIKSIRVSMIFLILIITLVALIFSDIVDVSILAGGTSLILSVPILYLLFGGLNSRRFIGSVIGGIIGLIGGIAVLGIEPSVVVFVLIPSLIGLAWNFGE